MPAIRPRLHGPRIEHSSTPRRRDYLDRIVVGGFPEAVRRAPRRRTAFFDSYLSTLIEPDVLELADIERRGDLLKLLGLLAGRTDYGRSECSTTGGDRAVSPGRDQVAPGVVEATFSARIRDPAGWGAEWERQVSRGRPIR